MPNGNMTETHSNLWTEVYSLLRLRQSQVSSIMEVSLGAHIKIRAEKKRSQKKAWMLWA